MRVAPFGDPRISGYLLLPAAYRSLSRPSSAPSAKASALRSSSFDQYSIHTSVCGCPRFDFRPPSRAAGPQQLRNFRFSSSVPNRITIALMFSYLLFLRIEQTLVRTFRFSRLSYLDAFSYMRFSRCVFEEPCLLHFFILAATYPPAPSPVQYSRPVRS